MSVLHSRRLRWQHHPPDEVPKSIRCLLDECGCVHVPQPCIARLGLGPRDRVFLGLYRGMICLWQEPSINLQDDADYLGQYGLDVEYDGTVSIAAQFLKDADLADSSDLIFTSWGNELSVSECGS
jgi:hypothetical protein